MFPLALFSPLGALVGKWRGYLFAFAVGASVAAWGMWKIMDWYQDSIQNAAWEFSIQRLQEQASKDRAEQAAINKRLAEIDQDATQWRRRYKDLQRSSQEVQDWGDTRHPDSIRLLLNGSTIDLSSERDSRP